MTAPVGGVYKPPVVVQIDDRDPTGLALSGLNYAGANKNNFGFINRETFAETGWINLNNRFYMPELMRFGQIDPITDEQENYSPYQYAWNNPVLRSDPNGEIPVLPWLDAVVDVGFVLYDAAVLAHEKITTGKTSTENWAALGADGVSILVPMSVGAGMAVKASMKALKKADKAVDVAKTVDKVKDTQKVVKKTDDATDVVKTKKVHGNKLDDKPAEGYTLRDKKTGEVKKYGETARGEDKYGAGNQKRYSKKELKEKDVYYQKEASGTKKGMHKWQNEKIKEHKSNNNGNRPPLNKSDY